MIAFKSCPRCKVGDVVTCSDVYGPYALCLQCGHLKDLDYEIAAGEARRPRSRPVPLKAA